VNRKEKIKSILNSYEELARRDPDTAERFIQETELELTREEARLLEQQLAKMEA
jgi:hypothetical protein